MNPTSVDICAMLEAESSLGLVFAENLFVGSEPAEPDDVVTVYDTPGRAPQVTSKYGENYFYPSVQIRVRSNRYLDGWELINKIKLVLHNRPQQTWNSTLYSSIVCTGDPFLLEWDENRRACFVANFNIQRR